MASQPFTNNNDDDSNPFVIRRTWSSEEEDTTMAGKNRGSNKQEMQEILVKWQIPGNHVMSDAKKYLMDILMELMIVYPTEVIIVDHKQREWLYDTKNKEEEFTKECGDMSIQIHPIRNKEQKVIKWVAITKIHTHRPMSDWKNNDHFYSQMIESKIYMFPHPFRIDDWDISSIGFIKNVHVTHHTQEYLHETIQTIIKKQDKEPPTFQLIPQKITNKDKTATTRAYTVQCSKKEAKRLIHLMTSGDFRTQPIFIPFRYKNTQPEVFTKCIRQQNEIYHRTWVIKLTGITPEIMAYLREHIEKLNGVSQIVPTRNIRNQGEWKILVDQSKCSYVHKQLTAQWYTLIANIPEQVLDTAPSAFSAPQISSQKVRDYQDDTSDNDSYGSLLTAGTEVSATYDDEQYNDLPSQYTYPTYASAAAASTTSNPSSQVTSPTLSTLTDWQKEKQELEQMIRQQADRIEQIQADLEAKITRSRDLEEQLAQAIELAHSRDAQHAEMLLRFETLMNSYGQGPPGPPSGPPPPPPAQIQENSAGAQQVTPPSRPMTTQSPPPKKSNTSVTPTRSVYPVFRKPEVSAPTSASLKTKRPPPISKHQADIQEDKTEPTPGVQAGSTQQ